MFHSRAPSFSLLASLCLAACVPAQEGEDQCPDVNYEYTADKAPESSLVTHITVDAYMSKYLEERPSVPGCSLAIARGGEVWYTRGYGLADISAGRPMVATTPLPIASMSKTLTAAAILRLQDDGLLDIDDPVSASLPGVPADKAAITLRQLLSHQGGLPRLPVFDAAWDTLPELAALYPTVENPVLHPLLLNPGWLDATKLAYTPGSGAWYSGAGFILLGSVIDAHTDGAKAYEGVGGYERFTWAVAASAGSEVKEDAPYTPCLRAAWRGEDIPGLALGYEDDGSGKLVRTDWVKLNEEDGLPPGFSGPSGGWTMTTADYARFLIGLDEGRILSAASLTEMTTREVQLPNINNVWYGLGVALNDQLDRTTWQHGGTAEGYRSRYQYWPEEDVGVVVVCNGEPGDLGAVANDLGDLVFSGEADPSAERLDLEFVDRVLRIPIPPAGEVVEM